MLRRSFEIKNRCRLAKQKRASRRAAAIFGYKFLATLADLVRWKSMVARGVSDFSIFHYEDIQTIHAAHCPSAERSYHV